METINILWTGGWDSTFRIIELSKQKVNIQPYYVLDKTRNSQKNELKAMEKIQKKLEKDERTKAQFFPIELVEIEKIPQNEKITKTYKEMHKLYHIGSQYDYLARLALKIGVLELGLENAQTSKAFNFIKACGGLKKANINGLETYIIDEDKSSNELNILFENFSFPIIDKTKLDMKKIAFEEGYEDIMNMTWFCHNPIHNEPCGVCNPCISTMEEGMKNRFTEDAIKRYKMRKIIRPIRKVINKVKKWVGNKVVCNE